MNCGRPHGKTPVLYFKWKKSNVTKKVLVRKIISRQIENIHNTLSSTYIGKGASMHALIITTHAFTVYNIKMQAHSCAIETDK